MENQIKSGFKREKFLFRNQIDIPKDWSVIPLEEFLGEEIQGGFASGERDENGITQLRMNNITPTGEIDLTKFLKVPIPTNISDYKIKKDDILFNNTNSFDLIGKSTLVKKALEYTFSN